MSENSLGSLPRFLSEGLFSSLIGTPNKESRIQISSRPFALFIRNVNSTTSKHEEEQVVRQEMEILKEGFTQPSLSLVQMRDYVCRLLFCHMLGYNVSWGHINAIKLASQGTLLEKRIGYLTACLMLNRSSEVVLLMTGTLTKDLHSSNILDNMAALSAASQLVSKEYIPHLLQYVLDIMKHPRELVRQKAVMCLHQFQLLAPDLLEHNHDDLQRVLYDKDPGVMAAAVHVVQYQIMKSPGKYEDIGQSLLDILRQVIDRKMSSAFEYHSIQLPWLQIQILRCLSLLVTYHERLKGKFCLLIKDLLLKLNVKETMGFAILYECICCIIVINPERSLLDIAAQHVGRLLRSFSPNLKYIGVKALTHLVQVDSQYAMNYQALIVDSLESEEINIQKKMYKLLYQIANQSNVEAVCSKLIKHFTMSEDRYWMSEVIRMVIDLAERFPISPEWQVQTLLSCVQQGHDLLVPSTIRQILDILEKEYIVKTDVKSRQVLVQKCVTCLSMTGPTPALIHIASWTLGELCSLLQKIPKDKVVSLFTKHLCNPELTFSVKSSLVSALQKLLMNQIINHHTMAEELQGCMVQQNFVIKQRLSLLLKVCQEKVELESLEFETIDTTLSFLDDCISQCLESGGSPYLPPHLRKQASGRENDDARLFQGTSTPEASVSTEGRGRSQSRTSSNKTTEEEEPGIKIGAVNKVWGRQGRLTEETLVKNQSSTEVSQEDVLPNKTTEKAALVSALFSGLSTPDKAHAASKLLESEDEAGFSIGVSEDASWRSVYSNLSKQSSGKCENHPDSISPSGTDIEIPRRGLSTNSDIVALDFNATEMLVLQEQTPNSFFANEKSTENDEDLRLNSTAKDINARTNFTVNSNADDFGQSADSTNDYFSDALSSLMEDNSSFLNISISSTDQNQVFVTRTKCNGTTTKPKPIENKIPVTETIDFTGCEEEKSANSDQNTGEQESIYLEAKSLSLYDEES